MYAIHSRQEAPHENLQTVVEKHAHHVWQKKVSALQQQQFAKVSELVKKKPRKFILDSGCGTGKSTEILAARFPHHWVVGVDKSQVRLAKNAAWRDGLAKDNMILVRADVIDFWQQVIDAGWTVEKHFIFYPNPYPKKSQLNKRWHGHGIFPALLKTAQEFEVRSNWRIYLEEFQLAAQLLCPGLSGCIQRVDDSSEAMTAFERKYFEAGERCYALALL